MGTGSNAINAGGLVSGYTLTLTGSNAATVTRAHRQSGGDRRQRRSCGDHDRRDADRDHRLGQYCDHRQLDRDAHGQRGGVGDRDHRLGRHVDRRQRHGRHVTVNATALGTNMLTLSGSAPETVNNLAGTLTATGLSGALTVSATGSGTQSVTTGTGNTSITDNSGGVNVNASAMGSGNATRTLTLIGSGAETVTNANANIVASGLSGALNVTVKAGTGNESIAMGTGSNAINAGGLVSGYTLTLTGVQRGDGERAHRQSGGDRRQRRSCGDHDRRGADRDHRLGQYCDHRQLDGDADGQRRGAGCWQHPDADGRRHSDRNQPQGQSRCDRRQRSDHRDRHRRDGADRGHWPRKHVDRRQRCWRQRRGGRHGARNQHADALRLCDEDGQQPGGQSHCDRQRRARCERHGFRDAVRDHGHAQHVDYRQWQRRHQGQRRRRDLPPAIR